VTPIRPNAFPVPPTAPSAAGVGAEAARAAAQKAFFDAAMGRATAAQPATPPSAQGFTQPPAPAQVARVAPDSAAQPPTRLLRPGSLLDIRV
jgi:hypothetical protein